MKIAKRSEATTTAGIIVSFEIFETEIVGCKIGMVAQQMNITHVRDSVRALMYVRA